MAAVAKILTRLSEACLTALFSMKHTCTTHTSEDTVGGCQESLQLELALVAAEQDDMQTHCPAAVAEAALAHGHEDTAFSAKQDEQATATCVPTAPPPSRTTMIRAVKLRRRHASAPAARAKTAAVGQRASTAAKRPAGAACVHQPRRKRCRALRTSTAGKRPATVSCADEPLPKRCRALLADSDARVPAPAADAAADAGAAATAQLPAIRTTPREPLPASRPAVAASPSAASPATPPQAGWEPPARTASACSESAESAPSGQLVLFCSAASSRPSLKRKADKDGARTAAASPQAQPRDTLHRRSARELVSYADLYCSDEVSAVSAQTCAAQQAAHASAASRCAVRIVLHHSALCCQ